jgi:hypothetical protein
MSGLQIIVKSQAWGTRLPSPIATSLGRWMGFCTRQTKTKGSSQCVLAFKKGWSILSCSLSLVGLGRVRQEFVHDATPRRANDGFRVRQTKRQLLGLVLEFCLQVLQVVILTHGFEAVDFGHGERIPYFGLHCECKFSTQHCVVILAVPHKHSSNNETFLPKSWLSDTEAVYTIRVRAAQVNKVLLKGAPIQNNIATHPQITRSPASTHLC